jgi:hypothetical protein
MANQYNVVARVECVVNVNPIIRKKRIISAPALAHGVASLGPAVFHIDKDVVRRHKLSDRVNLSRIYARNKVKRHRFSGSFRHKCGLLQKKGGRFLASSPIKSPQQSGSQYHILGVAINMAVVIIVKNPKAALLPAQIRHAVAVRSVEGSFNWPIRSTTAAPMALWLQRLKPFNLAE